MHVTIVSSCGEATLATATSARLLAATCCPVFIMTVIGQQRLGALEKSVSFSFSRLSRSQFHFLVVKKMYLSTVLCHFSPSATQATHLRATAYDHDAGEDNGGVHATHLETHQYTLSAAHAPGPDVHARPTGARAGLPGCDQAQGGAADDLRLLHGLESRDAALGCVHET